MRHVRIYEVDPIVRQRMNFPAATQALGSKQDGLTQHQRKPTFRHVAREPETCRAKRPVPSLIAFIVLKFSQKSHQAAMASHEDDEEKAQSDKPTSSPDDLTQYRQTAQQSSIDALRAAEDRYEKAKQSSAAALGQTKEAAAHGLGATTAYVAAQGSKAKDSAVHATRAAGDYTAEKGQQGLYAAKEGAVSVGQMATQKGQQSLHAVKEGAVSAGQTVTEKGQQGLQVVKDTAVSTGRKAADYTQQAAGQTKEYVVEKGQRAKDMALQVGARAVDYAGEEVGQAKDVGSGQKDEESKHEHGEQRSRGSEQGKLDIGERSTANVSAVDIGEGRYNENMAAKRQESREKENRGSLLGAVGETIADIARSTKNLVIGRGDD